MDHLPTEHCSFEKKRTQKWTTPKVLLVLPSLKETTLAMLYGECRLLHQNFLMPPNAHHAGVPLGVISQPIQHPNVDKPKSRYISDFYQL